MFLALFIASVIIGIALLAVSEVLCWQADEHEKTNPTDRRAVERAAAYLRALSVIALLIALLAAALAKSV